VTYSVGDKVRIAGRVTKLVASTPGGWEVSPAVRGARYWTEDKMRPTTARVVSRHIKLDATRGRFVCLRCGGTRAAKLPMHPLEYARAVDGFWQEHAACVEVAS